MLRNCVGKIGYVKFWFRSFNKWPRPDFPKNRSKKAKSNPIFQWKGTRDTALILRFLDSPMAEFNLSLVIFFFDFGHLQEEKEGQSGTKRKIFGCLLFLRKFEFFQNSWNTVCLSSNTTYGASFSKIGPYLGELGPKNPQKWPNSWMLHCHETFLKFITWEPQKLWRWNLARLCIFVRPFIWQKIWAWIIGR